MHVYEIRPRRDHRGVNLISDVLPFGRLWDGEADAINSTIGYAKFYSRSHDAVIRFYDKAGNVIETHEHAGDSKNGKIALESFLNCRTEIRLYYRCYANRCYCVIQSTFTKSDHRSTGTLLILFQMSCRSGAVAAISRLLPPCVRRSLTRARTRQSFAFMMTLAR
jgi:hypothetical protein